MTNSFIETWYHKDSPLLWIEMIFHADMFRMKDFFGFSYSGHYFISRNQVATFFKNTETEKKAKRFGMQKYSQLDFFPYFENLVQRYIDEINDFTDIFSKTDLKTLSNKELIDIKDRFFLLYSSIVGIYRFCRPDFYEFLTDKIRDGLEEPKDMNFHILIDNEFENLNIDDYTRQIALGLNKVRRLRYDMHKFWLSFYSAMKPLFSEIGERLNISSIEVQNCRSDELTNHLDGKQINREELQRRIRGFKLIYGDHEINIEYPSLSSVPKLNTDSLKGLSVFPGRTKAKTTIIHETLDGVSVEDIKRMPEGNILITGMTSPDMVLAIEKSSAIVTDEGGLLCHAAIVSREMKKPCIIATKYATKIFKDNDLVEVDAFKGIVKKIQ